MADTLGKNEEAERWRERAANIRRAIYTQLRFEDGTFTQFKHPEGHLEPRQHVLAAAFVVLADVVSGDEAVKAVNNYPVTAMGVPLHDPFYPNEQDYHNNAAWPFCDAFFIMAREKALGIDESALHFALLASVFKNGSFHERVNFLKKGAGGPAQLWSAAPFLGRAARFCKTEL